MTDEERLDKVKKFVDENYQEKLEKAINLLFDDDKRETKETQDFLDDFIDAPFVMYDCLFGLARKIFDATPIEQRGEDDEEYMIACESVAQLYLGKYELQFGTREYMKEQLKRAKQ